MNIPDKPHYRVSAGIIWKDGKILISKRPKGGHLEDYWEFPGGKQKKGESIEECMKREIDEELGISIKVDDLFFVIDHDYGTKFVSLYFFNCSILTGEPEALQCQEVKWLCPDELPKFKFPPPDEKIIEYLSRCI